MALNQKQAKELREKLFGEMKFDGFTVEGRTKEGLALADENQNIVFVYYGDSDSWRANGSFRFRLGERAGVGGLCQCRVRLGSFVFV